MNSKPEQYELHHAATGGTIDSHWSPSDDTAIPNDQTVVPEYLDNVRLPRHKVTSETICLEDSRKIGIDKQDQIAARISESPRRRIIGTSGTYLMPDISTAVMKHPAAKRFDDMGKKVVMTGSGVPIKKYIRSDGGFSLGMATAVLQEEVDASVLLTMNGMVLDVAKGVRKDLTKATFSSTDRAHDVLGYDKFTLVPVGGSIDFELDGLDGLVPASQSAIPAYLRDDVQIQRKFDGNNPYVRDSRELKDEDLDLIVDIVRGSTAEHVLVTLGIYEIRRVQAYLRDKLKESEMDRKILLTGSRFPLRATDMTDAPFNLGYALGKIPFVDNGVNIAMNGFVASDEDNLNEIIFTKEEIEKIERSRGA